MRSKLTRHTRTRVLRRRKDTGSQTRTSSRTTRYELAPPAVPGPPALPGRLRQPRPGYFTSRGFSPHTFGHVHRPMGGGSRDYMPGNATTPGRVSSQREYQKGGGQGCNSPPPTTRATQARPIGLACPSKGRGYSHTQARPMGLACPSKVRGYSHTQARPMGLACTSEGRGYSHTQARPMDSPGLHKFPQTALTSTTAQARGQRMALAQHAPQNTEGTCKRSTSHNTLAWQVLPTRTERLQG